MLNIKRRLDNYRWSHFAIEAAIALFLTIVCVVFLEENIFIYGIMCVLFALCVMIYAIVDFIDMGRVLSFIPGASRDGKLLIEIEENDE